MRTCHTGFMLASYAGSRLVNKDADVTQRCTRFNLPRLPGEGRLGTQLPLTML